MEVEEFSFESLQKEKSGGQEDFKSGFKRVFSARGLVHDNNFEVENINEGEKVKQNKYTENDIADSRTKGYEEGYSKGYKDARTEYDGINEEVNLTLSALNEKLIAIADQRKAENAEKIKTVAGIVVDLAEKIAGQALSSNPVVEVEKVVSKSFGLLFDEPKVVINVSLGLVDAISKKIDALANKEGFSGEVEIKGNEDLKAGDCTVEWKGGGLKSDKGAILDEVKKISDNLFVK